ncbi:MAG TPA: 2-dehydropantoate 2-reductase N-terminal domain-containing protein [Anaerolineaceae bacterium]|nr:2-dehydropantoate 2-reductase N-terminal domain-containing protein [Anaerolineaceae bacterium]
MKTLIVGTGVIGTIYGWALAEAGVNVAHYVRPGKARLFQRGVKLDVLDERKGHAATQMTHYNLHCVEEVSPADGYELIILPVTANQLAEALRALIPCVGEQATFLTFTSNWTGAAEIDALLPRERYLMGYPDGGGTIRDGLVWANLGAEVHLGALEGQSAEKLAQVKALFEKADMHPDMQENILHWLWVHNASAVGFATGYARYGEVRSFLHDGRLMKTCVQATRELMELCEKRGADWKKYPEVSFIGMPDWLVVTMMRIMWSTNKSMQRYTAHAASEGSLREMRYHFDAMLRSADELGTATPALSSLENCLA